MNQRPSADQVPLPSAKPRMRAYAFDWEPPAERIWRDTGGAARDEQGFPGHIHPDDRSLLSAAIAELSPAHPTYAVHYRVRGADGRERVFEEYATASFNAGGELARVLGIAADVTACCEEERQWREDLQAREAQLDLLSGIMDHVPALIMLYDPEMRDVRINRELERRLGWTRLDLNDVDLLEVCCPDPAQRALARDWLAGRSVAASGGEAAWCDIRMTAKDGTALDIAWSSVALNEQHRVALGVDVGPRKRAEQALRISEERLRRHLSELEGVYANAPVGLCVLDRELRFQRVNAVLADMNGLPAAEHIGRTILEVAPDLAEQAAGFARRVLEDGEPVMEQELRGATAARPGEQRIWLESWLPIKAADGHVAGISVVAREITEQRRAEDRLAASNARFRSMAETVPDILFTADAEGHCDYVNRRFERVTGMSAERALGLGWLDAVHPDDHDAVAAAWRRALKRTESLAYRYRLRCADGAWRWFETRIRPVPDALGDRRWFGAASDIDELVRAREALEEADKQKNEFLAILGHELRNPMAPVRSAVDVMETLAPEHPKLRWAIGVIDRQSRHMGRLLDDLLDVSRIVRGKLSLETRIIPVGEVVDQAVDGAAHLMEARRHHFAVDLPEQPIYLDADPSRLCQVLTNLLTNAAKYTAEAGHIRLSVEGRVGLCVIRVSDDGEGIDPELRAGLFDAFTQGRRQLNRAPGGLGLGLTIAARLTELHGGRIEVHSEGPGKGAEFTLFLPRCDTPPVAAPTTEEEQTLEGEPPRILVVDDNPDVANGMGMLLEVLGYPAQVCLSGAEALDMAERFQPRLVLLDIGMDDMDGFETARRLRAVHEDPTCMRLVAVSGYGDAAFQAQGRQAGFDEYLTKPVGRRDLLRLLRSLDEPGEAA